METESEGQIDERHLAETDPETSCPTYQKKNEQRQTSALYFKMSPHILKALCSWYVRPLLQELHPYKPRFFLQPFDEA